MLQKKKKLFTYEDAAVRAPILLGLCKREITLKCGRKSSIYNAFYNCIKAC